MANKQIKDFTAQATPQTGDFLLMQQAADDAVRKVTMQSVADFAEFNSTRQILIGAGDSATDNGQALKDAYAAAKAKYPTLNDWVTIKLTSGIYDFGSSGLVLDGEYIAIIGEGESLWTKSGGEVHTKPVSIVLCDSDTVFLLPVRHAVLANFHIKSETTTKACLYITNANFSDHLLCRNMYFEMPSYGNMAVGAATRGNSIFIDCAFLGSAFYNAHFGGYALRCSGRGSYGWAAKKTFDGYAKDCYWQGDGAFGGFQGGTFAGLAEDCVCEGDQGFGGSDSGGDGIFSGTARRCRNTGNYGFGGNKYGVAGGGCFPVGALAEDCVNEGNFGFAGGAVAGQTNFLAGIARRCRNEGDGGFAGGFGGSSTNYITGTCEDCQGGDSSFGAGGTSTGTLRRCQSIARLVPIPGWNGKMIGCEFKVTAGNVDCLLLVGDDSLLYNNILIGSGTGKSIEAAAAQDMVGNGNAMNLGLGGNVTNLVAGTSDVIDTDIDL